MFSLTPSLGLPEVIARHQTARRMGSKTVTTSTTMGTLQTVERRRIPASSLVVLSVKLGGSLGFGGGGRSRAWGVQLL